MKVANAVAEILEREDRVSYPINPIIEDAAAAHLAASTKGHRSGRLAPAVANGPRAPWL